MRHYRHALDSARAHTRSLWVVIIILAGLNIGVTMSLFQSQSDITIHIPPDLKTGATLQADKPLAANVYAFATYIFQQLNRWPQDGSVDFSKAIYALSSYLTPSFRESLVTEMETKASRGELAGRERGMTEMLAWITLKKEYRWCGMDCGSFKLTWNSARV